MAFTQTQVDEAFAALGLEAPSPAELTAIEAVNGPLVFVPFPADAAAQVIAELPEVQTQVAPIVQVFEAALGHAPTSATLASMVQSNLTESQLAAAIVSSQAFANANNGGALLDPNAPVSNDLLEVLFIRDLGHPPTEATLADFGGLTNAQAFLAFATSDTVTQALPVQASIISIISLATGVIGVDPSSSDAVSIVGQNLPTHATSIELVHIA